MSPLRTRPIRQGRLWLPTLVLCVIPASLSAQTDAGAVARELRDRFDSAGSEALDSISESPSVSRIDLEGSGSPLYAVTALAAFYAGRSYMPAWTDDQGPLPSLFELVDAIRAAHREGLNPLDYHLLDLDEALAALGDREPANATPNVDALADLDLLASDAFMLYGSHLLSGRVNPESIHPEWIANRRGADFAVVLEAAVSEDRVSQTLQRLAPPQPAYARLRAALSRYRALAARGGWTSVPEGPSLRMGDRDERVVDLRRRLESEELIAAGPIDDAGGAELFDGELDAAVRVFQARHGLSPDGVVGDATLEAMNVPVEDRVGQIRLNLERWRWLPERLGARYLLVNIAAYSLIVVEEDSVVLGMRAIVGRPYRRTPVFTDTVTYLVFNPYWYVPHDLAVLDKLPLIKKDPGYLAAQKIHVYGSGAQGAAEIDPATVDWAALSGKNFPYRLIQDPGPQNALGRVKFMFPNAFNVYLHDTPGRELFAREQRDFSSGCIRLESPIDLAVYLLAGDPAWSRKTVEEAVATGRERTVVLPRKIPVHLLYWTAWANEDGSVSFRRDIYQRDAAVLKALDTPPDA